MVIFKPKKNCIRRAIFTALFFFAAEISLSRAENASNNTIPLDLAAQYGTTPSPELFAAIQTKVEVIKSAIQKWVDEGRDPSPAVKLMQQVPAAKDAGDLRQVEYLIDHAYAFLTANTSNAALSAFSEETSDLYIDPVPVEITGYTGQAMEPFISPDGQFLFFNNENDSGANINLHFAERTGTNSFRYLGELSGANEGHLNATPTMDKEGHFYFSTDREYPRTLKSTYTGTFDGHRLNDVHAAPGEISANVFGTANLDVGISPDGDTLYIARMVIPKEHSSNVPDKSTLMMARRRNSVFEMDPRGDEILKNINTGDLNYAPAVSQDGRELYFTRAPTKGTLWPGQQLRIMVATRNSEDEPFGKPRVLSAMIGTVEAPSMPLDLAEMFFHKKVNGKWTIYRAVRKKG